MSNSRQGGAPARAAGVVLAALAISVCAASSASAHSDLVGSVPAAGAVVDVPPQRVQVTFSTDLLAASLEIRDGCGREVPSVVDLQDSTAEATLDLAGGAGTSGGWVISWAVVGEDGHDRVGTVPFQVEAGTPDCSSASGDTADVAAAAPVAGPRQSSAPEAAPSIGAVGPLLATAVVVVAGGAGIVTATARRRRPGGGHRG